MKQINFSSLLKITISLLHFISLAISDFIYPDLINPFMVKNPNRGIGGQSLILKFSLSKTSIGLSYGQVIGLDFPDYPQMDQIFFDGYENYFTCSITDTTGIDYPVTPIKSDGNSFACKYNDENKNLVAQKSYIFTISIADDIKFTLYPKICCLNLFTATSGTNDKLYIDSNPSFADMALYPNHLDTNIPPQLSISELKTSINPINVYSTFNLILKLKLNSDINLEGKIIVMKLPTSFNLPQSVISTDIDLISGAAPSSFKILTGTLKIEQIDSDKTFVISGVDTKLILKRNIFVQIILKDIYVGDSSILNQKIEVFLYYKNTYSVLSYDSSATLTVSPISIIGSTIGHPENMDVYQSSVAPLKIDFSISNNLPSGGYVVIQHDNIHLKKNKFNFIASTCDFSRTTYFNQNLGERPICFNYKNRLDFISTESVPKSGTGSGIVFKLPALYLNSGKSVSVSVTVFGYNELCGNTDNAKISGVVSDLNSAKFSFSIKIYKKIDMSKLDELRFTESDIIIKTPASVDTSHTCFSTKKSLFLEADYIQTSGVDKRLYFEATDFRFAYNIDNNSYTRTNVFSDIIAADLNKAFTKGYISNPENKNLISNSYLTLVTKFKTDTTQNKYLYYNLATPVNKILSSFAYIPGIMKVLFSKNFLQNGDSSCYFSWGNSKFADSDPSQTKLLLDITGVSSPLNLITSDPLKTNGWDVLSNLLISDDVNAKLPLQIISKKETGSNFFFNKDYDVIASKTEAFLVLYSSCFKFQKTFNYKSIYDYFELSINFYNDENNLVRINRFFKFMGNAGLLDESKYDAGEVKFHSITRSRTNSFTDLADLYNNGICIIELTATNLKNSYKSYSNKLIINISNMLLLDFDYTDISTTYPNNNNISAYANPSFPLTAGKISSNDITETILFSENLANKNGNEDVIFQVLGSNIFIDINSSNINSLTDLLIPVLCPVLQLPNSKNKALYLPSLSIYWATMNDYNSIRLNSFHTSTSFQNFLPMTDSYYRATVDYSSSSPIYTSIRFAPYFDSDENKLYILPGAPTVDKFTNISGIKSCTSFTLLISSNLRTNVINPTLKLYSSVSANMYKGDFSKGQIYFYGIPFKSMLFARVSTPFTMTTFKSDSKLADAIYFTGVRRPIVSDFYDSKSKTYNFLNLLAFQCVSNEAGKSTNHYFSNYNFFKPIDTNNIRQNYFILDSNVDTTTWKTTNLTSDKPNESVFKNDVAGNFKLILKSQNSIDIPSTFAIQLQSTQFTSSTICGINSSTVPVKTFSCALLYDSGTNKYTVECLNPNYSQDINICCYNIINIEIITFPTTNIIYYPTNSVLYYSDYVFTTIFNVSKKDSSADYSTGNTNASDLLVASQSGNKFNNIQYTIANQEGAYGKANLSVALAREIVRGSLVVINGDFTNLQISDDIFPKCSVVVAGYPDIVESCNVDLPTGNVITVAFKNNIYSCGATFPKSLNIYLSPVSLFAYSTTNPNPPPSYSITIQTSRNRMIVNSNAKAALNFSGTALLSKVAVVNQLNLCVIDIFPYIPGEISDYIFTFDIAKNINLIPITSQLNEFMVFFPDSLYDQKLTVLDSLKCKFRQGDSSTPFNDVNCSLLDSNLLIVSLVNNLSLSGQNPQIQIIGIPNTFENESYSFACAVNNYVDSGQKRTQVINGTGRFDKKMIELDDTKIGALELFSITTENPTPSDIGKITLKIRVDSFLTNPITELGKFVVFIVFLPYEFDTSLYNSNSSIKGKISEFFYDDKGILTEKIYVITLSELLGNRFILQLTDAITVNTTFSHFEIYLEGLINPSQQLDTTGRFRVLITNKYSEFVYKTFTNTGSVGNSVLSNPIDLFLKYSKGLKFFFNSNKWQLELFSNEFDTTKNLYVKKGRFIKYILRPNINSQMDNSLEQTTTRVSIKDTTFLASDKTDYLFSTSKGNIEIYLGIPCTAVIPNNYYVNFEISNLTNFYKINPFILIVDASLGTITVPGPLIDAVRAGTQFIPFTLSDPTFAPFTISFSQGEGTKNDSTAAMEPITFPFMSTSRVSVFKITTQTAMGFQNFQINNPNICYNLNISLLTINVNAENNDFSLQYDLTDYITFYNSDTDSTLNKNSINIVYTPTIAPVFLFCSLVCFNRDFPSDENLYSPGTNFDNSDPLVQYSSLFIPVSFGKFNLLFNGLLRGNRYKLKCLAMSTLAENAKYVVMESETITKYRKKLYVSSNTFLDSEFVYEKNLNGLEKLYDKDQIFPTSPEVAFEPVETPIKVSDNISTHCMKFGSIAEISEINKKKLLNYCQKQFVNYLGCTICVDNLNNKPPGMDFSKNTTCYNITQPNTTSTPAPASLRNMQTLDQNNLYADYFYNNGNLNSPFYYTICAVQDLLCDNDIEYPIKFSQIIMNMVYGLKDSINIKNNLNVTDLTFNSLNILYDKNPTDITILSKKISGTEIKTNGYYSLTLIPDFNTNSTSVYYEVDLLCYWMVQLGSSPPIYLNIVNCRKKALCGSVKIYNTPVKIEYTNPNANNTFDIGTYNVWFVCFNNIPNPTKPTSVISLLEFNISPNRILVEKEINMSDKKVDLENLKQEKNKNFISEKNYDSKIKYSKFEKEKRNIEEVEVFSFDKLKENF